jgi:hypothetical protein
MLSCCVASAICTGRSIPASRHPANEYASSHLWHVSAFAHITGTVPHGINMVHREIGFR